MIKLFKKLKKVQKKRRKLVYPISDESFLVDLKAQANKNAFIIKKAYYNDRDEYALNYLPKQFRNNIYLKFDWYINKLFLNGLKLVWSYYLIVKKQTGLNFLQQIKDLWKTCDIYNLSPDDYYLYKFYLTERKDKTLDYVYRLEMKRSVYLSLHKHVDYKKLPPVTNKVDFYKHAKQSNLPVIPVYYSIIDGKVTEYDNFENGDLFVKPKDGKGGRGITAWLFEPE